MPCRSPPDGQSRLRTEAASDHLIERFPRVGAAASRMARPSGLGAQPPRRLQSLLILDDGKALMKSSKRLACFGALVLALVLPHAPAWPQGPTPSIGAPAPTSPPAVPDRPTLVPDAGDPVDGDEVTLPAKPAAILSGSSTWDEGSPMRRSRPTSTSKTSRERISSSKST